MRFRKELQFAALSDTGLVRSHNEDAVYFDAELGLAVLADGMGGYKAGEVASQMTITVIQQQLHEALAGLRFSMFGRPGAQGWQAIDDAIQTANAAVWKMAQTNQECTGMGTTVILALCLEDKLLVAHAGDSRAYRYRGGNLTQLSVDHSVLQEQLAAGIVSPEEARHSPIKNLITRAVGAAETIVPEFNEFTMQQDDTYLLCSDGLTDMLSHDEIRDIIARDGGDAGGCCRRLVDAANQLGGRDNVSVVLVKISVLQQESMMRRIFASQ